MTGRPSKASSSAPVPGGKYEAVESTKRNEGAKEDANAPLDRPRSFSTTDCKNGGAAVSQVGRSSANHSSRSRGAVDAGRATLHPIRSGTKSVALKPAL